jgi:signal transduction histidine kinase
MTSLNQRLIIASGALVTFAALVVVLVSIASDRTGRELMAAAASGIGVAAALFAIFIAGNTRAAGRRARGDAGSGPVERVLAPPVPRNGVRETIVLDNAFNTMSGSLQETRGKLRRLVEEQAALHRVATLVAHGECPRAIFFAVAKEVGQALGADITRVLRYEPDGATTVIGVWGGPEELLPIDTKWTIVGSNIPSMVRNTSAPARMDCFDGNVSPLCVYLRRHGVLSGVGTPITVNGKCWGVMTAFSAHDRLLPPDAETRICAFTDLVAAAIVNAHNHADLIASRARIVTAADDARRRIERDLHDGTQQRLVSLAMEVRTLERSLPACDSDLRARMSEIGEGLNEALDELRETARGIHPGSVTKVGFVPAIKGLAFKSAVPVTFDTHIDRRLPDSVEVAAYYVVAESLTNAAKHSGASTVNVQANISDGNLHLLVRDDGHGGADSARGSGLTGLADRIEALHGTIEIVSPPGEGTRLQVELPITGG